MRLPQHMANKLHAAQTSDSPYAGGLKISLTSSLGPLPIKGASVTISLTGDPDSVVETLTTDESGQTDTVELPAPPVDYSSLIPNTTYPLRHPALSPYSFPVHKSWPMLPLFSRFP